MLVVVFFLHSIFDRLQYIRVYALPGLGGGLPYLLPIIFRLDGLTVELCGCWLWISGNTREHKEALKAAGCRWSKPKAMWYWRHPEDGRSYYRSKSTMSDIRMKYGSQVFRGSSEETGFDRLGATA